MTLEIYKSAFMEGAFFEYLFKAKHSAFYERCLTGQEFLDKDMHVESLLSITVISLLLPKTKYGLLGGRKVV